MTTKSIVALSTQLLAEGANVVYTHKFGSDSIESFFGTLRQQAGPRASSNKVMLSMRSLMLSKVTKYGSSLSAIRPSSPSGENFTPSVKLKVSQQNDLQVGRLNMLSSTEKQALFYMSGSIVQRILKENSLCVLCTRLVNSRPTATNLMQYDSASPPDGPTPPEFFTFMRNFGGLTYVSYPVFNFICGVALLFNRLYPSYKCSHDIVEVLREKLVRNINLLPFLPNKCNCNLAQTLIEYSVKPLLNAQLNRVNRFDALNASIAQRHRVNE